MSQSTSTTRFKPRPGGDQARGLRELIARRPMGETSIRSVPNPCHTIVVAGGKGGIGRSVLALNLAVALSQRGARVGLVDASPDFGNIELLCGLNGYWNLSHVMQGCRQLKDVILEGPGGIQILTGANSLRKVELVPESRREILESQLDRFEHQMDWLIVDGSGGSLSEVRTFALAADDLLVVATPEPTSVAEAYATIKAFGAGDGPRLGLLVNRAESTSQAQQILDRIQQAAHHFLQVDLHRRGMIPVDAAVSASVNRQNPVVLQDPESAVSKSLLQLAQRWVHSRAAVPADGFFKRLCRRDVCESTDSSR